MNICFMLGGFTGNGGIGRVTSMLAGYLAEVDGFHITTLSYANNKLQNLYTLSEKIEQKYFLQENQSMSKTLLKGGVKKLRGFLVENKVDILIACGVLYFPVCVLACKRIATKCICWEHTDPNTGSDYKFQNFARKYGANRADCNVVLTKRAQEFYQAHYRNGNIKQIYNPIDEQVLARAGEYRADTKKIISVGRLSYPKYFQMAIQVAAELLPQHPDWQWDIYGDGEQRQELAELIRQKGLEKQMHLMGQVGDLYDRYGQYGIMVMTSRYEGFPMSLLEGMGNGLPLVSFNINTGPDEIIADGINGYLVEAFDQQKMENRILRLMEDAPLRQKMSAACKRHCDNFSQQQIVRQWEQLLNEMTAKT